MKATVCNHIQLVVLRRKGQITYLEKVEEECQPLFFSCKSIGVGELALFAAVRSDHDSNINTGAFQRKVRKDILSGQSEHQCAILVMLA